MEAIAMPIALNGGGDGINGRRGEVVMRPMAAMAGYRPSMRAVTVHGHPPGGRIEAIGAIGGGGLATDTGLQWDVIYLFIH